MPFAQLSRVLAWLTALLGLELAAGWLLQVDLMVRLLPSSNATVMNTALGFMLTGSALLLGQGHWQTHWRRTVAVLLIVVGSLILAEDVLDLSLGLDWPTLHHRISEHTPRPGRAAPNTCMAMMLIGLALLNYERCRAGKARLVFALCCAAQLVLVVSGLVGLLLDPTLMFGWYKFNRMAAPTALGLTLATLSMLAHHQSFALEAAVNSRSQQRGILISGTLILLGMGMAAALTTFVIFANYQQAAIRSRLLAEITSQTRLAEYMIDHARSDTASLTAQPLLRSLIETTAKGHHPDDAARLAATLHSMLQQGFSTLTLTWMDATPALTMGQMAQPVQMKVALAKGEESTILWSQAGFFFESSSFITGPNGHAIARLTAVAPMSALSSIYTPSDDPASSADFFICGQDDERVKCFPSRRHPAPLSLPPRTVRSTLPIDRGLAGESGVDTTQDFRGVNVVAAFSHIGNSGLSVVSKIDAVELYEPINFLLSRSAVLLAIALAVGTLLLRRTVAPLVRSILRSESQSRASEARAIASERRLRSITDNVPSLIGFIDNKLIYRFANATHERWFGKRIDQIIGASPEFLLGSTMFRHALPDMLKALEGIAALDKTYASDGSIDSMPDYLSVSFIPERDEDNTVIGFNVVAFDTTEHHEHQAAMAHLAYHDGLTDLPNRRLFQDRLGHALARAQRNKTLMALMYLDIDKFKQINDLLGHEIGDLLLKEFGRRLVASVRATDTVARMGGDEFTIVMEGLHSRDDALAVARKILIAIRSPFELNRKVLSVTTSIGIAYSDMANTTNETLRQRSDLALYAAKGAGRNRYACFDDSSAPPSPLQPDVEPDNSRT
jgi:diguanylate cyclase (GGDEF)-like protein